jgi:hypothetical protein
VVLRRGASMNASEVDWTKLKHARGSAAGVPALLDDLLSPEETRRKRALVTLNDVLYARDKWFPAAGAAVPRLLDLAEDPRAPRAAVIALLAEILTANHEGRLASGLHLRDAATKRVYAKGTPKEVLERLVESSARAVRWLADPDPGVRGSTAFLLAFLDGAHGRAQALSNALDAERDPEVRASLLMSLGYLTPVGPLNAEMEARIRSSLDDPDTRGIALLVLARHDAAALTPDAVEPLATLVASPARGPAFPWARGKPDVLVDLALPADKVVVPRAFARAVAKDSASRTSVLDGWAKTATYRVFPRAEAPILAGELDPLQREVLGDLSLREFNGQWFNYSKVPHRAVDRRRWLGLAPATALESEREEVIEGTPRRWPLWRVLYELQHHAGRSEEDVDKYLAEVVPEVGKLLAVYSRMVLQAYGLKKPSKASLQRTVDRADATTARSWATETVDELRGLEPDLFDWATTDMGNVLAMVFSADGELPGRYDDLVSFSGDPALVRALLARMTPGRREAVFVSRISKRSPMALSAYVPLLDACPTPAVIELVFQRLQPQVLDEAGVPSAARFRAARIQELQALGKSIPAIAECLQRSGEG